MPGPTLHTETHNATPTTHLVGNAQRATAGLDLVARLTAVLVEQLRMATDAVTREPSALPGWTRGHLLSHLARNADALVNLLTWARTGIEHQLYPSQADRDADIEEGSSRLTRVMVEDLDAAHQRFVDAAHALSDAQWSTTIYFRKTPGPAAEIPWRRAQELAFHLVDLDLGLTFDDIADIAGAANTVAFLDLLVARFSQNPDIARYALHVRVGDGSTHTWTFGTGPKPHELTLAPGAALAWLSGRMAVDEQLLPPFA
jgi:maleylpyruvate isomerase